MTANAWHTLSDTLTYVVVIFSFWISSRPEDKEHPFGHGRAEIIATIIIATLLAVVGINFLKDSIRQLIAQRSASFSTIGLVIFAISVVIKEGLARFSIWARKKTDSKSLLADGWHHRSDALASLIIEIGAVLGKYFWWVDGVLGIGVSALILYAAYDIAHDASDSLMGEKTGDDLIKRIQKNSD